MACTIVSGSMLVRQPVTSHRLELNTFAYVEDQILRLFSDFRGEVYFMTTLGYLSLKNANCLYFLLGKRCILSLGSAVAQSFLSTPPLPKR